MQNLLGHSVIEAGAAYLATTGEAGVSSQRFVYSGTRPQVIMALGLGAVVVGVTSAAQAQKALTEGFLRALEGAA